MERTIISLHFSQKHIVVVVVISFRARSFTRPFTDDRSTCLLAYARAREKERREQMLSQWECCEKKIHLRAWGKRICTIKLGQCTCEHSKTPSAKENITLQ
jgi:hypothetical protein